ncbi:inorganic triphosphatase [Otariodibacter oris]|uniref:CYTH domain-containing protein n=1 Tax=Otariodibacter oris TaxID=1032623 RepID=A0A420XG01_9PAST|nr:CYTH domain-containing protein [Otariodibacter oris]QGM80371.1 adenylate cyclase [Otariodibacter oris]RKR71742.1 CYTH domain-containing protein [Otariodibacter oris]
MENEIELKIMLKPENISTIETWFQSLNVISQSIDILGNTYYDSNDFYFEKNQMGLRIRNKNNTYEFTLKMKGEIVGGLHVRPEYNLPLTNNKPDLKSLVSYFNLDIPETENLHNNLVPIFSTDFTRKTYLISFQNSEIEIAIDQGIIKNKDDESPICEIEFELKEGSIADLFNLLTIMPKVDGMWLSSLSKAQRGYWVGNAEKIAKELDKLTACKLEDLSDLQKYQITQTIADFIRLTDNNILTEKYYSVTNYQHSDIKNIKNEIDSADYLSHQITLLQKFYLTTSKY